MSHVIYGKIMNCLRQGSQPRPRDGEHQGHLPRIHPEEPAGGRRDEGDDPRDEAPARGDTREHGLGRLEHGTVRADVMHVHVLISLRQ